MSDVRSIDLRLIDTTPDPIASRKRAGKKTVEYLAKSISAVGLLHPIGLRKKDDGRYDVLWGRRRLQAFNHLKRTQIEARVVKADESDLEIMGTVENMFRSSLNKVQQTEATANWVRYQEMKQASKSGAVGGVGEILAQTGINGAGLATGPAAPRLDQALAETTGVAPSTARRQIATAKAFSPEQLDSMSGRDDVKEQHLGVIAKLPPEEKAAAVEDLAGGKPVEEVVAKAAAATKPPADPVMSDQDWLEKICAGIRGKLGSNTKAFDASALLYRHTIEQRNDFHKAAKVALDAAMASVVDTPFLNTLTAVVVAAHPRDWVICSVCGGHGNLVNGDKHQPCPSCRKSGFKVMKDKAKAV